MDKDDTNISQSPRIGVHRDFPVFDNGWSWQLSKFTLTADISTEFTKIETEEGWILGTVDGFAMEEFNDLAGHIVNESPTHCV